MSAAVLLMLAALLAISVAVPLQKPTFDASFVAKGEVEIHSADGTSMGDFTIARDEKGLMAYEEIHGESNQLAKMLQRYDSKYNKTYFVRGMVGEEHCISEESKGQLANFWDWIKPSTYEGIKTYRHVNLDLWGYTLADIRYEVAVRFDQDSKNQTVATPVLFNRYSAEGSVQFSIFSFTPGSPPLAQFAVPKECNFLNN